MKPFSHLKHAALSDVGKKRKNNEDAFGVFPDAGVFCVADGMGGGDDGEIASAAVVRAVEGLAARVKPDESGGVCARDVGDELTRALSGASAWICNRAHERKLNGCGSTFVGVVFDPTDPAQALAVHAGDSRLYLLHGRSIRQITRDHSVAELMGEKDESKVNPMFRSMVVNGIGIRTKAEPEFTPFKVVPGDRVLLCSDGLSRMVPDKRIASVARAEEDPDKAVAALIAAALDAGGIDNVTAVLVQVGELPGPVTRRELPASAPSSEEVETEDAPTSSDDTGKTDDTRTRATALTGIAEEEAFGEEPAKPVARRRLGWKTCFVLATAVVVTVCCLVVLVRRHRSAEGERSSAVAEEPVAVKAPVPDVAPAPVARPAPVSVPVANPEPASNSAPVLAPKPVPAVPRPAPVVIKPPEKKADDLAKPSPQPKLVAVAPDLIAGCSEDSARTFISNLRRLLPSDDRTPDFAEECERFLKSARQLVRTRGSREAEAVAVDLRVLLLNAESARSAPPLRRNDAAAKAALGAWDVVLKGDPSNAAMQAPCARLMKVIRELR